MRPLFVCPALGVGGAERHWAALLPALAERGAEPSLLTLSDRGALFDGVRAAGVPARCAGMPSRFRLGRLRRAIAEVEPRPDVVVAYGVSAVLAGRAIARRAGAPLVVNEHTPLTPDGRMLAPRPHQRVLGRLIAPRTDAVIAVARAQVEPLVRRGYRRERIRVIPNGVFDRGPEPARERGGVRAELGAADGDLLALELAALRPEKRVDAFLEAVSAARRAGAAVRGVVAGGGPEHRRLLAGLPEGVTLLGPRDDVPDLLAAADVLCLLSEAEALPMAILEAMATGLPVVSWDVGDVAHAALDGETGAVLPPGDVAGAARALAELEADRDAARRMGEAGRRRQRELFDGDRMADSYLRALEELRR